MVFCLYSIFKSNLCLPRCFFAAFIFFGFLLVAVKTLQYSQATISSRINTARPLPSSNYRHRAKLYSRDLLNLIKSQDFIKLPLNLKILSSFHIEFNNYQYLIIKVMIFLHDSFPTPHEDFLT